MPYYCLECGGALLYDQELKCYVCRSCGLTFTIQQLLERNEKKLIEENDKRKRQKEYLKWWSSKKV
ncbi:MAG: hypothetical protein QW476_03895 [Candidatus Bathyarchaeia archaeon]|nr:hypothetical protein [Candidatus Bathyarchaeota archaeon]